MSPLLWMLLTRLMTAIPGGEGWGIESEKLCNLESTALLFRGLHLLYTGAIPVTSPELLLSHTGISKIRMRPKICICFLVFNVMARADQKF